MTNKPEFSWNKQEQSEDIQYIRAKELHPYEDFMRDPTGYYVLIRVNFELSLLEVGICNKDHKLEKVFSGRNAQEIYTAIFRYEKKHQLNWFQEKTHIAYLGRELKKAELALCLGQNSYFQE